MQLVNADDALFKICVKNELRFQVELRYFTDRCNWAIMVPIYMFYFELLN